MNVSSVKNLNGETFSAVQDASLTDVVQTNSASWSFIPTYEYTDNNLISAIDASGLYAISAGTANHALWIPEGKRLDQNVYWSGSEAAMYLNPKKSPFTTTSGVFGMLQYATGASLDYYSQSNGNQYFGGFFKGNQWFVSDNNPNFPNGNGALMGELHRTRSVNISGSLVAGGGFVLHPDHVSGRGNSPTTNSWKLDRTSVSGLNSTGSWKYGVEEDTALRTVSALEYNAVDEISGIAGSAIAQYGAEKQWLVHDDTLVHAANSAQYALGVNLSAVAQLLGVDRTLLWSGSKGSVNDTMNLSEPISSFNKVEFIMNEGNTAIPLHSFISNTDGTILYPYFIRTNSNNAEVCNLWSLSRQNNDTRLSVSIAVTRTNGGTSGANTTKFNEIWGIGRKQ